MAKRFHASGLSLEPVRKTERRWRLVIRWRQWKQSLVLCAGCTCRLPPTPDVSSIAAKTLVLPVDAIASYRFIQIPTATAEPSQILNQQQANDIFVLAYSPACLTSTRAIPLVSPAPAAKPTVLQLTWRDPAPLSAWQKAPSRSLRRRCPAVS